MLTANSEDGCGKLVSALRVGALLAIIGGACGPGAGVGGRPAPGEAGIRIAESSPTMTIGCQPCAGPESVTPTTIALGDSGAVTLIDRYEPLIRSFGPTGEHLFSVGRKGPGPGEFRYPITVLRGNEGTVWVHETTPPSLVHLDGSGSVLGSIAIAGAWPNSSCINREGRRFYTVAWAPLLSGMTPELARLLSWDLTTGEETVLAPIERHEVGWLGKKRGWAVACAPNGVVAVGDPHEYRIKLFGPEGEQNQQFGKEMVPGAESGGDASLYFTLYGMAFDAAGRLWVQTTRGDETSTVFDLFRQQGEYLGEFVLPARVLASYGKAFDVGSDMLVAIIVDSETGHWSIRRWRIDG